MSDQAEEQPRLKHYQIAIRPHTDIHEPAPEFIAALAEQFDYAAYLAEGRIALTVPGTGSEGDDTPKAIEHVLHAAAAHRTATTDTEAKVRVRTGRARYGEDGQWQIVAQVTLTADTDTDAGADTNAGAASAHGAAPADSPAEQAFREAAARDDERRGGPG